MFFLGLETLGGHRVIVITSQHLQRNQILTLNNPEEVDMQ